MGFPQNWFKAIHMSLIPRGPHQGHVIVWDGHGIPDYRASAVGQTRVIRYAIVDPVTGQCWNHIGCMPPDKGDLFCAGHVWNAQGDLVIAGGTEWHTPRWEGATLVMVWQPPTTLGGPGQWWQPESTPAVPEYLQVRRWYPSLVMLGPDPQDGKDRILILGGTDYDPVQAQRFDQNSYECWEPSSTIGGRMQSFGGIRMWPGPQLTTFELGNYPRAHFLSNYQVVNAGPKRGTDRVQHDTATQGLWLQDPGWQMVSSRGYGSNVLYPISPGGVVRDYVVATGGQDWSTSSILGSVQVSRADQSTSSGRAWQTQPSLNHPRWLHQTVLLPDSGILVLGGEQQFTQTGCSEVPALVPELFASGATSWQQLTADTIIRDYHQTALLLPNGEVLTAGGESRHFAPWGDCLDRTGRSPSVQTADYRVFVPPNINCGNPRPSMLNEAPAGLAWTWQYGQSYPVDFDVLPFGVTVDKVTLLRAGSVTHHSDGNQRCVELQFAQVADTDPPRLIVDVPTLQQQLLPRGHYMLFLVTNQGTPSEAAWVQIQ